MKIWMMREDRTQYQYEVKTKRIVCPRCNGEGKHINPNIDGDGLTGEDFAQMNERDLEDFNESYLGGVYDVTCEECKGRNVIDEPDIENCIWNDEELRKDYERQKDDEAAAYCEAEGERRMGA